MNARLLRGCAVLALLCLGLLPRVSALTAYSFHFTQSGYDQGAYVQGYINVFDGNGDGLVVENNPNDFEWIDGFVRLIGHPTLDLQSFIYEGWFHVPSLDFHIAGDIAAPFGRIDWFGASSGDARGGFSYPLDFAAFYSTHPIVVSQVSDHTTTISTLGFTLVLVVGIHRRIVPIIDRGPPTE